MFAPLLVCVNAGRSAFPLNTPTKPLIRFYRGAAGSSLTSLRRGPWARHIYPSLVLVQPRKTRPCLTERLLMGRKESNQTKFHIKYKTILFPKL